MNRGHEAEREGERGRLSAEALLARMRRGELSEARVQLAAYCDHPGALLLMGEPRRDPSWQDPVLWLRGLSAWGPELLVATAASWLGQLFAAVESRFLREVFIRSEAWMARRDPVDLAAVDQMTRGLRRETFFLRDRVRVSGLAHMVRALRDPKLGADERSDRLMHELEAGLNGSPGLGFPEEFSLPTLRALMLARALGEAPFPLERAPQEPGAMFLQAVIDAATPPLQRSAVRGLNALGHGPGGRGEMRPVILRYADGSKRVVSLTWVESYSYLYDPQRGVRQRSLRGIRGFGVAAGSED